ncbi:fatty acid desaturase family protein [Thiolinea disciformis]|uniref:fatty acid desaturase family protein n=1 Tax=Thiolinea disciformis TaxID=125614 RepID=UPI0003827EAF|nr:fatty acid desaturase family protein [Thiolinea disciformis]
MSIQGRDYSLTGPENARAVECGLANATWYKTAIPRKRLKELMQRSDGPATHDTVLWLGSMLVFASCGIALWGTWWALPFFMAYGVLYGSAGDSRWHECSHGTAFKTAWKNDLVYQIACFMMMRNPVTWKWSHARHHTDTLIVGRDIEIAVKRPPNLCLIALSFIGVIDVYHAMKTMLMNATGHMRAEDKDYVPENEWSKIYQVARIWTAIYTVTIATSLSVGSWLPLVLIGLPRIYGAWHHVLTGLIQHAGLAEDTLDHRLNSRTCYMNPVSQFIYWNMNYHLEHHMFPMVPYHRLPELHEAMEKDCPPPYPTMLAAYQEIIPALKRQLTDPSYYIKRPLPNPATPETPTTNSHHFITAA